VIVAYKPSVSLLGELLGEEAKLEVVNVMKRWG